MGLRVQFAAILLIIVPLGMKAQSSAQPTDSSSNPVPRPAQSTGEAPKPYGDGQKGNLNYSGPSGSRNFFIVDVTGQTSYNDNVVGGNSTKVPDTTFFLGPDIWLQREGKHSEFALHYQPDFLFYAKTSGYNTLQQQGQLDGQVNASPHLSFRGRASGFYLTGISQPSTNTEVMSDLGPPSSLNQAVFTPLARETGYAARVDATYQFSTRTTVSIFAGGSALYFDQQATSNTQLLDTRQQTTGLIYSYRISRFDTAGFTYLLSYYEFGPNARTLVHNPYISYSHQFSPNWSARIYGGPAFVRSNNELDSTMQVPTVVITGYRNQWDWTLGGDLNLHLLNTAMQIGAQRNVSDGGGLLTTVIATEVTGSVRHKLGKRLDAVWNGSYTQNSQLPGQPAGQVKNFLAGVSIEDSIKENLVFRWGYNFTRQSSTGTAAEFGTLDRNIVYFAVTYRAIRKPLGR